MIEPAANVQQGGLLFVQSACFGKIILLDLILNSYGERSYIIYCPF